MSTSKEQLTALRDEHADWLAEQEGFCGCGLTLDKDRAWVLVVYASEMSEDTKQAIRDRLAIERASGERSAAETLRFEDMNERFRAT